MGVRTLYALILLTLPAAGQVSQLEEKRIADIQFSPVQTLDPADLAKALPFKKGDLLHLDDVATAIDNLFASGRYKDVIVEGEPSGDGVLVRFSIEPRWFVGGVKVTGHIPNPPNRTQIASTAQFSLGTPFEDTDVARATDSISKLLQSNGMYQSQVAPEVTRDDAAQQVFLTFKISGKKRARYETPAIQGGTNLSNSTIIRATGWRLPIVHWWRQVTALRTSSGVEGVQTAYFKKDRLEARVESKDLNYQPDTNRVRPTLNIVPGPRVQVKTLESSLSKSKLKQYVPIFQEHSVDSDLLAEGKRNLLDYFQSQGYYDVDVDVRMTPGTDDLQTIEYIISRGQRYRVVKVSLTGYSYFREETFHDRMYMQAASFTARRGRYSEAFQRKDEQNIADLYRANGFRDVKVSCVVDRNYQGKTGNLAVTVKIEEGPQWMVDHLTFTGVQQDDLKALTPELASVGGQPYADVNLAGDRSFILTYYYRHGYPDAAFKAEATPSHTPHHVDLVYSVNPGKQQFVRAVLTSGIERTRPSLVDKAIAMKAGDPLSPVEETNIQKNLYDLGVFARVDTAIQNSDGDTSHKYVLYNFEEESRYSLGVGFGLQAGTFGTPNSSASLSSPNGVTGVSPLVSFDISRQNFRGVGQSVGLHLLYSFLERRASTDYKIPRFLGGEHRIATFTILYDDSFSVLTFASKREEGSVRVSQQFSKSLTGNFSFAYRRVSVSNVQIPVLLVPQLSQAVRIGILTARLEQDRRDDRTDPHHGIYNTVDFGVASHAFGSQRSFGRILARNATYYRLGKTVVLARQTQFGIIQPFAVPAGISGAGIGAPSGAILRRRSRHPARLSVRPGRSTRYRRSSGARRAVVAAHRLPTGRQRALL